MYPPANKNMIVEKDYLERNGQLLVNNELNNLSPKMGK